MENLCGFKRLNLRSCFPNKHRKTSQMNLKQFPTIVHSEFNTMLFLINFLNVILKSDKIQTVDFEIYTIFKIWKFDIPNKIFKKSF